MPLLLIVDDDPGTLKLLSVVLRHQGHEVVAAETAEQAWALFNERTPDLVISDVHLPGESGLDLLARIRSDIRFTLCPVILLTSLSDRQHMRAGMQLGADDYITKPFRGPEIAEAVRAQVNRQSIRDAAQELRNRAAVERALQEQAQVLGDNYEMHLAHTLNDQWNNARLGGNAEKLNHACVAAFGMVNHEQYIERLAPEDIARWLKRFHEACGDAASLFGALNVHFHNEGALAVFASDDGLDPSSEDVITHSDDAVVVDTLSIQGELRALKASLALGRSLPGIQEFVRLHWPDTGLDPPELSIGLHAGPVGLSRLQGLTGGSVVTVPVGQTVNRAKCLQQLSLREPGTIAMTAATFRQVTGAVSVVRRELMILPGETQVADICWVTMPHDKRQSGA